MASGQTSFEAMTRSASCITSLTGLSGKVPTLRNFRPSKRNTNTQAKASFSPASKANIAAGRIPTALNHISALRTLADFNPFDRLE
jgi:hypothetical protein